MNAFPLHPQDALTDDGDGVPRLPVCDHYAGTPDRMRKALALQAARGPIFDVTLDAEDGAPLGGEIEHIHLISELLQSPLNAHGRVGVRLHPPQHPLFDEELRTLLTRAGRRTAYVMLPKIEGVHDVERTTALVRRIWTELYGPTTPAHRTPPPPLHVLIETHGALREVDALAAHPAVESLSFGLMDFVSAHRGAIPAWAMSAEGQFTHPLVQRAKLALSAAAHAHGKVPAHSVVTEFQNRPALSRAVQRARQELGYTRMWSIHPAQIDVIVEAYTPSTAEVDEAIDILKAAQDAHWAPIRHRCASGDVLHDRASYRYFWTVLQRAHLTGQSLPGEIEARWFSSPTHLRSTP